MTVRSHDYLERPPRMEPERQATPNDGMSVLDNTMRHFLKDIRNQLLWQNPTVLCQTRVQGNETQLSDTNPVKIWFEVGGKPVQVSRIAIWQSGTVAAGISPGPMATANDGFQPSTTRGISILSIFVTELYLSIPTATVVGINTPSTINAQGSIFIYGWTIPDQIDTREQD